MKILRTDTDGNGEHISKEVNQHIQDGHIVFVLIYMEGCGPCNATRPEWEKMETIISQWYKNVPNLVVATVDHQYLSNMPLVGPCSGFPTLVCVRDGGARIEAYEDAPMRIKNRTSDSFIEWVDHVVGKPVVVSDSNSNSPPLSSLSRSRRGGKRGRQSRRRGGKRGRQSRSRRRYGSKRRA